MYLTGRGVYTGKLEKGMAALEKMLGKKKYPHSKSVGALLLAHSSTKTLPVAFKILKATDKYPAASLPPNKALVTFLRQCERDQVDKKALKKVQVSSHATHSIRVCYGDSGTHSRRYGPLNLRRC